ncbi:sel1 repeat family protein [Vibrio sp. S9_S30]|uniref:sel1 repeat family protein n=1 Tax=Vibrio sp. S9_S30 TaxID=2720226 RepID=UPI001681A4DD|nr:sel1 repeat family protein [Vibrio sp. S9_S30]MBD1555882.1 sel1 repeat family protein [Vibrio sp. S9_S30]
MKKLFLLISILFCPFLWADNSIERGIRLFNQKEYALAQELLLEESKKGSAYATYWLGVVQYKNGEHFEAGDTFLKAAEMGSPWAMAILAGKELNIDSPCDYLGWPCDEQWAGKAFEGWKTQAENGNGKAMYAMRVKKPYWWELVPYYRSYKSEEIYSQAFEKGSDRAVMRIGSWVSEDKALEYIKAAANKGYAPAMVSLYYHIEETNPVEAGKWLDKAIKLGYPEAAEALYFKYHLDSQDNKKTYYYNKLFGMMGGRERDSSYFLIEAVKVDGSAVFDEDGKMVTRRLISQEEQDELDRQVEEFVKDIKINLFLDETSIELF